MPDQITMWTRCLGSHWFLVGHWTKCAENGNIWPKMTKYAYFGPNLAVFGPKILSFMGVSKSFGTNITENHKDNLFASFFGQALDQMGQIWPFLGPKSNFLGAGSKNLGTLILGFQWDTFFVLKTLHYAIRADIFERGGLSRTKRVSKFSFL